MEQAEEKKTKQSFAEIDIMELAKHHHPMTSFFFSASLFSLDLDATNTEIVFCAISQLKQVYNSKRTKDNENDIPRLANSNMLKR